MPAEEKVEHKHVFGAATSGALPRRGQQAQRRQERGVWARQHAAPWESSFEWRGIAEYHAKRNENLKWQSRLQESTLLVEWTRNASSYLVPENRSSLFHPTYLLH